MPLPDLVKRLRGDRGARRFLTDEAANRIEDLENMVRSTTAILDEIASAAGFQRGDTYSASTIIARLADAAPSPPNDVKERQSNAEANEQEHESPRNH